MMAGRLISLMLLRVAPLLLTAVVLVPPHTLTAQHRSHSHSYSSRSHRSYSSHRNYGPRTYHPRAYAPRTYHTLPRTYVSPRARDEHGRFIRSSSARARFMRQTGYPGGRSGFVVDHIVPLACGGSDSPANMQWQRIEQGHAKDRLERRSCTR